jgi:hypothetical protein
MRFKKWRNRPGCEGAFRLFLLSNRCRVQGAGDRGQGAGCRVQGAGAGGRGQGSVSRPTRPTAASRARTLSRVGCPLGGWGWMMSETQRKHSAGKTEFQEKS